MKMKLLALTVAAFIVLPRTDARGCEPIGYPTHLIVSSMAMDQTPPTLSAVGLPEFHFASGDSKGGCGGSYCPDVGTITIPVTATDDWTKPAQIGYRLTLIMGTLAPGLMLPVDAIEPGGSLLRLYWDSTTGHSVDFTLQVVAIDLAGNESAPQMVRVEYHADSECSIGGARPSRFGLGGIAILALIVTAYRRRRP